MSHKFDECAEDLSEHSKDISFYDNLVSQVQQETLKKKKVAADDPYDLRNPSETAYFMSNFSQQSLSQLDK